MFDGGLILIVGSVAAHREKDGRAIRAMLFNPVK